MSTPREIRAIARSERASEVSTKPDIRRRGVADKKLGGPGTRLHAQNADEPPEGEIPGVIAPGMNNDQHAGAQDYIAPKDQEPVHQPRRKSTVYQPTSFIRILTSFSQEPHTYLYPLWYCYRCSYPSNSLLCEEP